MTSITLKVKRAGEIVSFFSLRSLLREREREREWGRGERERVGEGRESGGGERERDHLSQCVFFFLSSTARR